MKSHSQTEVARRDTLPRLHRSCDGDSADECYISENQIGLRRIPVRSGRASVDDDEGKVLFVSKFRLSSISVRLRGVI